ncbi:DUF418 domain-containing protein [Sphingomonas sp.]|uniref:DUF418 domain-containing protein n=1 Tax=Sphingomonas sp. TaxID=28214 RepID=UPI00286DE8F7|nr:DUF418 domain-containing protein [Sphingomonas sp.]
MTEPVARVVTLDIVRGVAVMGILAMNIVAFAMPPQAYVNPLAFGTDSAADLASWAASFIFIDGKMRGLFSLLFGASLLLVIQRAEAKGEPARAITFRRLLWLLLFGYLHFTLIWYGDILVGYALIGMLAWHFRELGPRGLLLWALALILAELAVLGGTAAYASSLAQSVSGANPDPGALAAWQGMAGKVAIPDATTLAEELALYRGPWSELVGHQLTELTMPLIFTAVFGWETLAYMLLGMAGLKSGFLTGAWDDRGYRKVALIGFAIAVPAYAVLAWLIFAAEFNAVALYVYSFAATVPFRPLMIVGYAALIILATGRGGWLVTRIAAAGRAAFTNYLGTSLIMTALFYGWGLGWFGHLGRAELWLMVLAMWLAMLAWSKPWLERFGYGPFEWLWRSLARWEVQPMRKRAPGAGS